jgi:hypothetical protein
MDDYISDPGLTGLVEPVYQEDAARYSSTGNLIPDAAWYWYGYDGSRWVKTGAEWTIEATTVDTIEKRGPYRAKLLVTGGAVLPTLDSDFINVGVQQVYAYALEQALTRTSGRFLVQLLEYNSSKSLVQTTDLYVQDGGSAVIEEFDSTAGWTAGTAAVLSSDGSIKRSGTNSMKLVVTSLGAGASSVNFETSTTQDITGFDPTAKIRWSVRAGTRTNLNYVALRWGSDASNYYEWRATNPGDLAADDTWYDQADVLNAPDATVGTPDTVNMDYLAVVPVAGGAAYTGNIWVDIARIDPVGGDAPWPSVALARFMGSNCVPLAGVPIDVTLKSNTRFVKLRYTSDQLANGTWYVVSHTINDGLLASPDANPLAASDAYVYMDAAGLIVQNGRILFKDQFNQTALTGYGFGPTWVQFVRDRIFNSSFAAGSTSDIPVSQVGTGSTEADYRDSLSPNLPSWVVAQSDSNLRIVSDANATHGLALESSSTAASQTSRIYQDIPVLPGGVYVPLFRIRYDVTGTPAFSVTATVSWRANDHSIIGSSATRTVVPTVTVDQATYLTFWPVDQIAPEAPSNAVYLRVEVLFNHTSHTGGTTFVDIWLDGVRLYEVNGGWAAQAAPAGVSNNTSFSASSNLAAVSAGAGGAFGQMISVPAPMLLRNFTIWSTDTSLQRDAEIRLYRDIGATANIVEVPGANATFSFTPSAASRRSALVSGHPLGAVFLEPSNYWVFLRNTSTARTFGIGVLPSGSGVLLNPAVNRADAIALAATLDAIAGGSWTQTTATFGIALRGTFQGVDWA